MRFGVRRQGLIRVMNKMEKDGAQTEFVMLAPLHEVYSVLNQKIYLFIDQSACSGLALQVSQLPKVVAVKSIAEARQFLQQHSRVKGGQYEVMLIAYSSQFNQVVDQIGYLSTQMCFIGPNDFMGSQDLVVSKFSNIYMVEDLQSLLARLNCKRYLKLPNYTIFTGNSIKSNNNTRYWMMGWRDTDQAIEDFLSFAENSDEILADKTSTSEFTFELFAQELRAGQILSNPARLIQWYTSQSFLYRLINKSLRLFTSPAQCAYLRVIFKPLFNVIQRRYWEIMRKGRKAFTCYRGCQFTARELSQFASLKGSIIQMNGFISTSKERSIAENYGCNLLEINVPAGQLMSEFVLSLDGFAEISNISLYPSEEEVVFLPWNLFEVKGVTTKKMKGYEQTILELDFIDIAAIESKPDCEKSQKEKQVMDHIKEERDILGFALTQGDSFFLNDDFVQSQTYFTLKLRKITQAYHQSLNQMVASYGDQIGDPSVEILMVSSHLSYSSQQMNLLIDLAIWKKEVFQILVKLAVIYHKLIQVEVSNDLISIIEWILTTKRTNLTRLQVEHRQKLLEIKVINYGMMGRPELALNLINSYQQSLLNKCPKVLLSQALMLQKFGRYREAFGPIRRCLKIFFELYGPRDPEFIRAITVLASIYGSLGHFAEATSMMEELKKFQKTEKQYLFCLMRCSELALQKKELEIAADLLAKIKQFDKPCLQQNFKVQVQVLTLQAKLESQRGRLDEAFEVLKEAVSILLISQLTPMHIQWIQILRLIGEAYFEQGSLKLASDYLQTGLALIRIYHQDQHHLLSRILMKLGEVYTSRGFLSKALSSFIQVLSHSSAPDPQQITDFILEKTISCAVQRIQAIFILMILPQKDSHFSLPQPETAIASLKTVQLDFHQLCGIDLQGECLATIERKIGREELNSIHREISNYAKLIKNEPSSVHKVLGLLNKLSSFNLGPWNLHFTRILNVSNSYLASVKNNCRRLSWWQVKAYLLMEIFLFLHRSFNEQTQSLIKILCAHQQAYPCSPLHQFYDVDFYHVVQFIEMKRISSKKSSLLQKKNAFMRIFCRLMRAVRRGNMIKYLALRILSEGIICMRSTWEESDGPTMKMEERVLGLAISLHAKLIQ